MKNKILKIALLVAILAPAISHAVPITYTVNRAVGGGSVVGTIETDGTIGVLSTANINDWNLTLTDLNGSFVLNGLVNSQRLISGTAFSATVNDLLFDFSAGSGFVLLQNPGIGSSQNFWCIDNGGCINANVPGETVRVNINGAGQTGSLRSGSVVIGSVARNVPEPGILALLGLGLAGLGFTRRK